MGSRNGSSRRHGRAKSLLPVLIACAAITLLLGAQYGCQKVPQIQPVTKKPECRSVACNHAGAPRVIDVWLQAVVNQPTLVEAVPNEVHACIGDRIHFWNKNAHPVVVTFSAASCPFSVCTISLAGLADGEFEVTPGPARCHKYRADKNQASAGTTTTASADSSGRPKRGPIVVVDF